MGQPYLTQQQYQQQYPQPMLGAPPQMGPTIPGAPVAQGGTPPQAGQFTGQNAPPGYTPGSVGPGQQTAANPFSPLEDAAGSIYRALLNKGLNPDFPTWGINQLLKRAEDIVRGAAGRAVLAGQADMLAGGGFQQMINELIGSGRGVISGPGEGRAALNAISSLLAQGQAGGGAGGGFGGGPGMGAQYLNALFGTDPGNASQLAQSLLYGALNSGVRSAVARPLAAFPERFQQFVETEPGFQQATNRSALDILLSNSIPGYSPFGGGGAGVR